MAGLHQINRMTLVTIDVHVVRWLTSNLAQFQFCSVLFADSKNKNIIRTLYLLLILNIRLCREHKL